MRYLHHTKNGTWYFRYQISPALRHLFNNKSEIKKSLKTSCRLEANLFALRLEIDIKTIITNYIKGTKINNLSIRLLPDEKNRLPEKKVNIPLECLEKYCLSKSDQVTPKTNEGNYAKCKIVLSLLNNKDISKIRRIDADEVKRLLQHYPTNARKHQVFNGLTTLEIINTNKTLNYPTLSNESIKNYIHKSSGFFEWCLQMELTDINPFRGFKFKNTHKVSESKHHYSPDDMTKIFGTEIHMQKEYLHPYYYWLPIMASVTGARINELCQLYTSDIKCIDGNWIINFSNSRPDQKLKTPSSRRQVPLHSCMIKLGFIDFIHSLTTERIFPELPLTRDGYGKNASRWFSRFKNKLGFERKHDFHSFRHTFVNDLKQKSTDQIIVANLIGHSQGGITYDRYGKDINMATLKLIIEKINVSHITTETTNSNKSNLTSKNEAKLCQ